MNQIPVSQRVIFNPVSKTIIDTWLLPVCQFQDDETSTIYRQLSQRESVLNIYTDEIVKNGGEISVNDNGDIAVSKQRDEQYNEGVDYNSFLVSVDYYFFNVSEAEHEIMSVKEQEAHIQQIQQSVYRKYIDPEIAIKFYGTDGDRAQYFAEIAGLDRFVRVRVSIEETLSHQLTTLIKGYKLKNTKNLSVSSADYRIISEFIKSEFIFDFLNIIKVQQISISKATDIRFQLLGVIKSFYPFIYFKNGCLYDLGIGGVAYREYNDMTDIYNVSFNPSGDLFDKEITVSRKNLMCICKQMNIVYISVPVGRYKQYALRDPEKYTIVGSEDLVNTVDVITQLPDGITLTRDWSNPRYVNTTVTINNAIASSVVSNRLDRAFKQSMGTVPNYIGTKSWNESQQVSRFQLEYGFSVPILQSDVQSSTTIRFKSPPKFAILFVYDNDNIGKTFEYYINKQQQFVQLKTMQVSDVKYRGVKKDGGKIWPFLSQGSEDAEGIEEITRETQTKRDYMYQEGRIENEYIKGDYIWMNKMTNQTSAGYVALTLSVGMYIPTSASIVNQQAVFSKNYVTINLKSVFKVSNINDYYQTRDLVMNHRFNMLAHLYSTFENQIQQELQISGISSAEEMNPGARHAMQAGVIKEATIELEIEDKRAFDDIYTRKERTLHSIYAREFKVLQEVVNLTETNNIYDLDEMDYMYEMKSFSMARQEKESYSMHSRIVYNPIDLPIDFTVFTDLQKSGADGVNIYLSALVPHVAGALDRGGGFIGKLEYKVNNMDVMKYIVSKAEDFVSGLSNSEQVRWDMQTMCTDGTERLTQSEVEELLVANLPTVKKDIGLTFRQISSSTDHTEQQNIFLASPMITNLILDHNYLSETNNIKLNVLVYEKGVAPNDPLS